MTSGEGRPRRQSIVASSLSVLALQGDNARRENVNKLIRALNDALQAQGLSFAVHDWKLFPTSTLLILSEESLLVASKVDAATAAAFGDTATVVPHELEKPLGNLSTRKVRVDSLAVRVFAGVVVAPLKRTVWRLAVQGLAALAVLYFFYVTLF
jgi:hypothetical protein